METKIDINPVADIFPMMTEDELDGLKADIKANGLLEPVWLHPDGSIIDGRNRYKACTELGIDPKFRTWDGTGSLVQFVISLNLHRRHLTAMQKAVVAAEALPFAEAEAKQRQQAAGKETHGHRGQKQLEENFPQAVSPHEINKNPTKDVVKRKAQARVVVAKAVGVNERYVQDVKKYKKDAPDVYDAIKSGKLNGNQAKQIAQLSKETRNEVFEQRKINPNGDLKKIIKGVTKAKRKALVSNAVKVNHCHNVSSRGITLINGDFSDEVKGVKDASIDLILTDPPYNISKKRIFTRDNNSDIDKDFGGGEWDNQSFEDFVKCISTWVSESERILVPGGSAYFFTSHLYLSFFTQIINKTNGLTFREVLLWCKTNPPPQFMKHTYRPCVEYIIFFTKDGGDHTFNWQGDKQEMLQYRLSPICGRSERVKLIDGQTLHPTQKPEALIRYLIEISSNHSDTIFDGFMGVGTTMAVSKKTGRRGIGIEQNKVYYNAAVKRIDEIVNE